MMVKTLLNSLFCRIFSSSGFLLWKPTNIIDINEINCDFEAPKLTENTSTVLMSNAEIEILNKRTAEKHPDMDGGPCFEIANLQKWIQLRRDSKRSFETQRNLYL